MKAQKHTHLYLHATRVVLIGMAFVTVGLVRSGDSTPVMHIRSENASSPQVLAYATNMNRADLFNATNSARAQNRLGAFSLNSKLNTSAQLKADDMIAKNYWSHNSPDGTQPWYWFDQSGYVYRSAAENLAYGFDSGDAVVDAWMNSTGHRANILGNFVDVGFGYAQGENFQGGQNTVVVGHYGTSSTPAAPAPAPPPPTPAPTTPAPSAPKAPLQPPTSTPVPTPQTPAPAAQPASPTPSAESPPPQIPVSPAADSPVSADVGSASGSSQGGDISTPLIPSTVTVASQLLSGAAPQLVLVGLGLFGIIAIGFVATHMALFRHSLVMGEQYIIHHPALDAIIVAAAAILILTTQLGRIS